MTTNPAASSATTTRDWLHLLATCLTGILIPLCFTGPAVVLPTIGHALGGTAVQLNWVLNGYILTYGSAMMAAGSLADIHGRKRVWLAGLALFVVTTCAIALAPTAGTIVALRLAQGLAGAMAFAGAMASLAQTFDGQLRTRVFSLLGTAFGVGLAFGPLAAGALVEGAGWRWVFLATGLLGLIAFLLAWASAAESRDPTATGLDWPGAISFTAALTLLTYGVLLAPEEGWRSVAVLGSVLAAGMLFLAFVQIERRVARPMLDLSLFHSARFVGVQVLAAAPAFFFVTLIVLLPGRFIGIDGLSALAAGKWMIALAAPLLVVPFLAGVLSRWVTAGALSALGLLLAAAGLAWLGSALAGGAGPALVPPLLLIGTGIGLPWGLMDAMAVNMVDKERAGMATGIFNAVRVSADGVAVAVAGALLAVLLQDQLLGALPAASTADVIEAGNRAALGDLQQAGVLLPGARALLLASYDAAFCQVLNALAGAAALTALLVLALLGRREIPKGVQETSVA